MSKKTKLAKAAMKAKRADAMQCNDCGQFLKSVEQVACPYAKEVDFIVKLVKLCDDCYTERAENT